MRKVLYFVFYIVVFSLCIEQRAYANIAPLKAVSDGVEPLGNPGVMIDSAYISVTPIDNAYRFDCTYTLEGLKDSGNILVGIPGDLGYTMEAGYIQNMNIKVNGNAVKHSEYNTTKQLSSSLKNYASPLNFKWYTFSVPIKKNKMTFITASYDISWRIYDEDKNYPYNIVPFQMSTDKLFGSKIGSYKVKYNSDDYISMPDVKVMISSVSEPNIISPAILSPTWNSHEISWEFKNISEFQDFRLVALSFRKLAMDFTTDTTEDHDIRWAMLNDDYEKLAGIFENIAEGKISTNLDSADLGTSAYLASEFYSRIKNYDKARDMLSLPNQSTLWSVSIKADYIDSLRYTKSNDKKALLEVYKRLSEAKDYILVSNYAAKQIGPLVKAISSEDSKISTNTKKDRAKKNVIFYYVLIAAGAAVTISAVSMAVIMRRAKRK